MNSLSDIEVVSRLAAEKALFNFKKEQKKKEKKAILHNTEVLLREYLELKHFYENCNHEDVINDEMIVVGSLRKDKATTRLLFHHVNKCLSRVKEKEPEKIKVIEALYLNEKYLSLTWEDKINQAMIKCNISQATAYRWKDMIISDLSVMLFGADGLRIWTI